MISLNEVRLIGIIKQIFPIKHFDNNTCMLLARIETTDDDGTYTHLVSFLNEDAHTFANNAQLGSVVDISAKLRPRPKKANEPNGELFFEILCNRFLFVSTKPTQPKDSIYPETANNTPKSESLVKGFFKKFVPQGKINTDSSKQERSQYNFVATEDEINRHERNQNNLNN